MNQKIVNLIIISLSLVFMVFVTSCDSPTSEIKSNKELHSSDISVSNTGPIGPIEPDPDPSYYDIGENVGCYLRKRGMNDLYDATIDFAQNLPNYKEGLQEGWNNCNPQGSSNCTTTTYINPTQGYVFELYQGGALVDSQVFSFSPNSSTIEIACNYYAF